jgi:hypothetical protein
MSLQTDDDSLVKVIAYLSVLVIFEALKAFKEECSTGSETDLVDTGSRNKEGALI